MAHVKIAAATGIIPKVDIGINTIHHNKFFFLANKESSRWE